MKDFDQKNNTIPNESTVQSWKDKIKSLGCFAIPLGCIGAPFLFIISIYTIGGIVAIPFYLVTIAQKSVVISSLIVLGAIAVHILSNWIYGKQVLFVMRKSSATSQITETEITDATENQTLSHITQKSEPITVRFKPYDVSARNLVDTEKELYIRDRLLNKSGKIFYYSILLGLVTSASIQITKLYLLWQNITPEQKQLEFEKTGEIISFSNELIPILVPFALAIALVYFLNSVHVSIGLFNAFVTGFIAHALSLLTIFTMQIEELHFKGKTVNPEAISVERYLIPILAYIVIVVIGWLISSRYKQRKKYNSVNGQKLLVLRVFGITRNTQSLFGHIVRRWPLIGPVVTIYDPTYAQFSFARQRYKLIILLALPSLSLMAIVPKVAEMGKFLILIVATYYLCWIPIVLLWKVWHIRNASSRNLNAIKQRLNLGTHTFFRTRYPSIRLICSGDLWKPTIAHLVKWTNMILMDLRGFDKDKLGCKYELVYLMNNWSFDKTVFLTDASTDASLFENTIREIAHNLEPTSPNAQKQELVVHHYISSHTPGKFRFEIQPLLALMGEIATNDSTELKNKAQIVSNNNTKDPLKWFNYLIPGSWAILSMGFIIGIAFKISDTMIYSGISIMWLGVIAILTTRRARLMITRDGSVTPSTFFENKLLTIILIILVGSWLVLFPY